MPVPSSIADLSTTAASNYPLGSDSIGTSLDDYLRTIQAIIKQQDSRGTDIASGTTITVPSAGSYFVVTGSSTIAGAADSWSGRVVALKFSGTPQLTHSSGFILPTGANITMAAGDVVIVTNESTGVWRVLAYQPASGYLVPSSIGVTVQAYDADTAKLDVSQVFSAPQKAAVITDNDLAFDLSGAGNDYSCTPSGAGTMSFTNMASNTGKSGHIKFVNGSSYAIAKGSNIKCSSTLFTSISTTGTYIIGYWCDGTDVYLTTSGAAS